MPKLAKIDTGKFTKGAQSPSSNHIAHARPDSHNINMEEVKKQSGTTRVQNQPLKLKLFINSQSHLVHRNGYHVTLTRSYRAG